MRKYTVLYTATASTIVEVEAEHENEAREIADEQVQFPSLCAHCSGWGANRSLNSGIELSEWEPGGTEGDVWEVDS